MCHCVMCRLSEFAKLLEKSVLKRILKHLWRVTIATIEKVVVLPNSADAKVKNVTVQ